MTFPDWQRIVPEEEAFCEWCGWSEIFCACPLDKPEVDEGDAE